MNIGFDISQTGTTKAGCGHFSHALIQAMVARVGEERFSLYPSFGDFFFDAQMPRANPYRGARIGYGPHHASLAEAQAFWRRRDLEAALGRPDIIHANNFWAPLQIENGRLIYTLYDIGFAVDPTWTTEANRVGCFEGVFRASVAADWVVAISEYTRTHFLDMFPHFPADRVRVVYPCSRFLDSSARGTAPEAAADLTSEKFWVSVGTIEPRKNQRMLVRAYADYLAQSGADMPLVFAGGRGWLMDDFADAVREAGVADKVIMTGYVSDDEMIWLYRNCFANLYPSLFEGFGLPVLEGMQFGAPTLCSDLTSLPEVAGDAGILLSPLQPDAWTAAMLALSRDPARARALGEAGRIRAQTFNLESSASQMLGIYRDAVAQPKRKNAVLDE